MKKSALIYAALASIPATALAAGAFDGTWKIDIHHVQLPKKPAVYVIDADNYTCSSCGPAYTVKADGTEQKVAGQDFDTAAVTVTPRSLLVTTKLKGKPYSSSRTVLSADGNSIAWESTYLTGAQPAVFKGTAKRVAAATPGANALSGSWLDTEVESASDAGIIETLGITDEGFTMSSNGQSYEAKFDGKKYPIAGDPTHTLVKLKKVSPTAVIESDYNKGKLVEIVHMTVTADGQSMHVVDSNLPTGRVTRFEMNKQP